MADKDQWDYLDSTHPDAILYNPGGFGGDFYGGDRLSKRQKIEYHKTWIARLNKELKGIRGEETNTYGVAWANRNQRSEKNSKIKRVQKKRSDHKAALKLLK